ncbi:MAG: hypothetical protein LUE31_09385 [Lachnospiraceae bacterium]|nr:hypothetical protein [Lachnospiraceae bacterium]
MGTELIQTYHMGFYICLAITVLGAILAVVFFFTLRIRDAWKMNFAGTGSVRGRRKGTKAVPPVEEVPEADNVTEVISFALTGRAVEEKHSGQTEEATELLQCARTEKIRRDYTDDKKGG